MDVNTVDLINRGMDCLVKTLGVVEPVMLHAFKCCSGLPVETVTELANA